jgi:hypothetical protein
MKVGTLSATGGQVGEEFEFSLLNNNGGRFALDGNDIRVAVPIGHEFTRDMGATRTIRVRATGDKETVHDQNILLNVTRTVGFDPRYARNLLFEHASFSFDGVRTLRHESSSDAHVFCDCVVNALGGKRYFEVELIGSGTLGTVHFGLSAIGMAHAIGDGIGGPGFIWASNGNRYVGETASSSVLPTFTYGDVLGIAYDPATGNLWVAKNNTWEGDPVAGTSPATTFSALYMGRLLRPFIRLAGVIGGVSARNIRLYGEAAHLNYSPPSGFSALAYTAPQPTRWNGDHKHSSIALSNGGRTMTKTANNGTFHTAIANSGVFGKMVWAWRIDQITGIARVGLQLHNEATNTAGFNASAYRSDTGVTSNSGSTTGTPTYATWGTGDIIMMAYDRATGKTWFGKNGTWNGNPAPGPTRHSR